MTAAVIFHLKKLWPFDVENRPSLDAKCARCGHTFHFHTFRDRDATCGIVGCRCREFMVNLYEEIKAGRKTSEWRVVTDIEESLKASKAWFVVGYPKGNLPRLQADITALIVHRNSHQFEIKFTNVVEVL